MHKNVWICATYYCECFVSWLSHAWPLLPYHIFPQYTLRVIFCQKLFQLLSGTAAVTQLAYIFFQSLCHLHNIGRNFLNLWNKDCKLAQIPIMWYIPYPYPLLTCVTLFCMNQVIYYLPPLTLSKHFHIIESSNFHRVDITQYLLNE